MKGTKVLIPSAHNFLHCRLEELHACMENIFFCTSMEIGIYLHGLGHRFSYKQACMQIRIMHAAQGIGMMDLLELAI